MANAPAHGIVTVACASLSQSKAKMSQSEQFGVVQAPAGLDTLDIPAIPGTLVIDEFLRNMTNHNLNLLVLLAKIEARLALVCLGRDTAKHCFVPRWWHRDMFSFPAFHSSEKQFRCSNLELWNYTKEGIDHHGWELESESSDTFEARVPRNGRSFGERITIKVIPRATLRATSKCVMPLQCVDFGKNRTNVMELFAWISGQTRKSSARQMR